MKLKTLTLHGFKSFADKTTIDFQSNLTGIVGPNGSGKSNVIEALQWVLGEQSAKNLRGHAMPDVIFAGTQQRTALSRAFVEVVFDNSDHFLKNQPDEITIARSLYRDGTSEYHLNHQKVRRKDVLDLVAGTGMGKESFAIISQGRVEAIFQAKPSERRSLIEEIAGVAKYKQEKNLAITKLAHTDEKLARISDIIAELNQQKEPLEQQASIARDYLTQKKRYDKLQQAHLVLQIKATKQSQAKLQQAITQLKSVKQSQQEKLAKAAASLVLHQQQLQQATKQADELQKQQLTVTRRLEQLSGQHQISTQAAQFDQEKKQALTQQQAVLNEKLAALNDALATAKTTVETLQQELAQTTAKLADHQKDGDELTNLLQQQLAAIRTQMLAVVSNQATLKSQLEASQQAIAHKAGQNAAAKSQISQLSQSKAELTAKLQTLVDQENKLTDDIQANQAQLAQIKTHHQQLQAKLADQQNRWYAAHDIYTKAKAQQETLAKIAQSHQGYYHGVKAVLNNSQLTGVCGAVADIIDVDKKYAVAIETTLGAALQSVVVNDEAAGKAAIDFLKQTKAGKATFLPLTSISHRTLASAKLAIINQQPGVVGLASQLVSVADQFTPVVAHLLQTTVIVDNLTNAITLANKLHHQVKIVTLAGEVLSAGGAMSGGSLRKKQAGLLEQKQQQAALTTQVTQMNQKLMKLTDQGKQTKAALNTAVQQINALDRTIAKENEQLAQLVADKTQHQNHITQIEAKLTPLQTALGQEATNQEATQVEAIRAKLAEANAKREQLVENEQAITEKLTKATQTKAEGQSRKQKLSQLQAVQQERLNQANQQVSTITQQIAETNSQLKTTTAQLQALTAKRVHKNDDIEAIAKEQRKLKQKLANLTPKLAQTTKKRDELAKNTQVNQANQERLKQLHTATSQQLTEKLADNARFETILNNAANELAQKFQTTYEAQLSKIAETDDAAVLSQLNLVKLSLDDIGVVNLGAIDEFKRVSERFEYLTQQRADLLLAKDQLNQSMNQLDGEVKRRFKATFDQVAAAFSQVFPKIFGGGHAQLKLSDESNLLETGIDIIAQPPGKKLSQLTLLSGGEKALTAIALLFAIIQIKPVPFVILDEAEAALDEANVVRYANYLNHFESKTQFIVITHRKGTMMNVDVLYGITMAQTGISTLVSMALASDKQ